jgi:hypothetical protein
VPAA